ncbi:hypothetical protein [Terribacillus saccharophilus]|nr:hypothetical protein [Terribacillus saccharophilus]
MKGKLFVALFMTIFVLGGCAMNNENESKSSSGKKAEEFPEVAAYQDEFTREFMESTKPTKEGYYPFLSKTDAYKMDFPENMTISERSYNIGPDNRSETVILSPQNPKGAYVEHQVEYYSFLSDEEHGRDQITSRTGLDINFEEISSEFQDQQLEIAEYNYENVTEIAALIWIEGKEGQIHSFSSIRCTEETESNDCLKQKEDRKNEIINWLKSIQLIDNESE